MGTMSGNQARVVVHDRLVLERLEDPRSPLKRLPFGMRGLWGPSVEAFHRRGLLERALRPFPAAASTRW